MLFMFE